MLECIVRRKGFNVTDTSTNYANCHHEFDTLSDGFDCSLDDDGYTVYGAKDALKRWIAMLEKQETHTNAPTLQETIVCWNSNERKGDFRLFQIHDYHALCSTTQKNALNNKFHAKASANCSVDIDQGKNKELCKYLRDTGTECLEREFNQRATPSASQPAIKHVKLTDKARRGLAFKNDGKCDENEDTSVGELKQTLNGDSFGCDLFWCLIAVENQYWSSKVV